MKVQKQRWEDRPTLRQIHQDLWVLTLTRPDETLELFVKADGDALVKLHRGGMTFTAVPDDEYAAVMDEPNTAPFTELGITDVVARLVRAWDAATDIIALV